MSRTEPVRFTTRNDISKAEQRFHLQMRLPPHPARVSPMPKTMELLLKPAPEHANSLPPRVEVPHLPFVEPVQPPQPLHIDKSIVDQIGQPVQSVSYNEFVAERDVVHAAFDKMVQSTRNAKTILDEKKRRLQSPAPVHVNGELAGAPPVTPNRSTVSPIPKPTPTAVPLSHLIPLIGPSSESEKIDRILQEEENRRSDSAEMNIRHQIDLLNQELDEKRRGKSEAEVVTPNKSKQKKGKKAETNLGTSEAPDKAADDSGENQPDGETAKEAETPKKRGKGKSPAKPTKSTPKKKNPEPTTIAEPAPSIPANKENETESIPEPPIEPVAPAKEPTSPTSTPTKGPDAREKLWNDRIAELKEFIQIHGHSNVSKTKSSQWEKLGHWVHNLRYGRKNLSPQRKSQLVAIGFTWSSTHEKETEQAPENVETEAEVTPRKSSRSKIPKEPVTPPSQIEKPTVVVTPAPETPQIETESTEEPEKRGRRGRTPKKFPDFVSTKPQEKRSPSPAKPKKGKKEEIEKPIQSEEERIPVIQHEDIHLTSDVEIDGVKGSTTEDVPNEEGEKAPKKKLKDWSLKFTAFSSEKFPLNIVVIGTNEEGERYQSSTIFRRIEKTELRSRRGTEFELIGSIDESSAIKYGINKNIIELFKEGFPTKWKSILTLKQRERPNYLIREEKRKEKQEKPKTEAELDQPSSKEDDLPKDVEEPEPRSTRSSEKSSPKTPKKSEKKKEKEQETSEPSPKPKKVVTPSRELRSEKSPKRQTPTQESPKQKTPTEIPKKTPRKESPQKEVTTPLKSNPRNLRGRESEKESEQTTPKSPSKSPSKNSSKSPSSKSVESSTTPRKGKQPIALHDSIPEPIANMTWTDLQSECRSRGLKFQGIKKEFIERLKPFWNELIKNKEETPKKSPSKKPSPKKLPEEPIIEEPTPIMEEPTPIIEEPAPIEKPIIEETPSSVEPITKRRKKKIDEVASQEGPISQVIEPLPPRKEKEISKRQDDVDLLKMVEEEFNSLAAEIEENEPAESPPLVSQIIPSIIVNINDTSKRGKRKEIEEEQSVEEASEKSSSSRQSKRTRKPKEISVPPVTQEPIEEPVAEVDESSTRQTRTRKQKEISVIEEPPVEVEEPSSKQNRRTKKQKEIEEEQPVEPPTGKVDESSTRQTRTRKQKEISVPVIQEPIEETVAEVDESSTRQTRTRKQKEISAPVIQEPIEEPIEVEESPKKNKRTREQKEIPVIEEPVAEEPPKEKKAVGNRRKKKIESESESVPVEIPTTQEEEEDEIEEVLKPRKKPRRRKPTRDETSESEEISFKRSNQNKKKKTTPVMDKASIFRDDVYVEITSDNLPSPMPITESARDRLNLQTTKSGRKVLPPLAYWKNQKAKRDFFGNTIAIIEGSPDFLSVAIPRAKTSSGKKSTKKNEEQSKDEVEEDKTTTPLRKDSEKPKEKEEGRDSDEVWNSEEEDAMIDRMNLTSKDKSKDILKKADKKNETEKSTEEVSKPTEKEKKKSEQEKSKKDSEEPKKPAENSKTRKESEKAKKDSRKILDEGSEDPTNNNNNNSKDSDDEREYEIEKIIKQRVTKEGHVECFVKWRGYPSEANSWVSKESISELFASENSKLNDHWTKSQLEQLENAIVSVDPSRASYWKEVAKKVRGKTDEQCRLKYQGSTPTSKKPQKKQKEESPLKMDEKGKIFKGRLKDRRKIRNILKQGDKNVTDDIFDSTPFKKQTEGELDISDEEEPLFKKPKTVSKETSKETPKKVSENSEILKPVDRNQTDSYIMKMKNKSSKDNKSSKVPSTTKGQQIPKKRKLLSPSHDRDVQTISYLSKMGRSPGSDSGEEKDHYFTSDED